MIIRLPFPAPELFPNRASGRHWGSDEDEILRQLWREKTHQELANQIGRTLKAVRNRCHRLGLVDLGDRWTDKEIEALKYAYMKSSFANEIDLPGIAKAFGRDKANVCRKAKELGLTNQQREMLRPQDRKIRKARFSSKEERSRHMSEAISAKWKLEGHPRGALGMTHSKESKQKISEASKKWAASISEEIRAEIVGRAMKTKVKNGTCAPQRTGTTWKAAWREIGGTRKYYRSKWEANYAHYLQWLKSKGQIKDWLHEPVTFWFEGIKRGCVSYLPDFWVQENDGAESYHEVKGWMDDRSKTKIQRMAKYHPKVKLIVIDSKGYAALKKSVQGLVPGWEP